MMHGTMSLKKLKYVLEDLKEQRGYWKLKRKQCGEFALEETVDLSQGRLQNE